MAEKIIEKISRYNLFNYLFPGVLFMILSPVFMGINFLAFFNQNLIASLFLAYFIGMIISRIGSSVVETILRWIKFIKFVPHSDYLDAQKKDEKIDTLSEENNIYRTLISLFLLLLIVKGIILFQINLGIDVNVMYMVMIISFLVLFLFSYKKQTGYINERIKNILNKEL